MFGRETRQQPVNRVVKFRAVIERPGYNQRCARFVDKDRVNFVDNREIMPALCHLREFILHIVAQIIKTEFIVRAIGDVGGIGFRPLAIIQTMHDHPDGEPKKPVNLAHPLRVAPRKIVVHRDNVHALARQRVQIGRQGCDKRLALARLHFRDRAFMQHHAANQLHIEMALPECSLGGFAHRCKGWHEQIIERAPRRELRTELHSACFQSVIAQHRNFRLKRVDRLNLGSKCLEPAIIGRTENFLG